MAKRFYVGHLLYAFRPIGTFRVTEEGERALILYDPWFTVYNHWSKFLELPNKEFEWLRRVDSVWKT